MFCDFCHSLIPPMFSFINARIHSLPTIHVLSKYVSHSTLLSQYHLGHPTPYWLRKSVRNCICLLLQSPWGTVHIWNICTASSLIVIFCHWWRAKFNPFVQFSINSEATGQIVINANTEMENVWSCASGRRITLWCNTKEVSGAKSKCNKYIGDQINQNLTW